MEDVNCENTPKEIVELRYWTNSLCEVLELNKGFNLPKNKIWIIDSESLLLKELYHALSVLDLLEGTKPIIPSMKINIKFIDYISMYAIVRSALETYLVFNYIFIDQKVNTRVKKLRFKLWQASSLSQRQKQQSFCQQTKNVLKKEKSQYLKMRREILNSKTFSNSISLWQKKKFRDKKSFDWKPQDGWRGIAKNTALSESYWVDVYNLLSSVVHANAVIPNQFSNPNQKNISKDSALFASTLLNYIIPLFIEGYAQIFPKVKTHLERNKKLKIEIENAKEVISKYGKNPS